MTKERQPDWTPAIELLVKRGAIAITGHSLTVLDPGIARQLPDPHDPLCTKKRQEEKRAKKRARGKRPASPWLLAQIAERKRREEQETDE